MLPKANNTAQFSTNATRDFFGIELLYQFITTRKHKKLHKIQIFLLPLTSLYTVSQMSRRPRNFMQTNRFQKEQSLTNFQGSISNFLGIHKKKISQSFYLNVFNGLRNGDSFHRGLATKLFHFKSLLLQSCIHLKYEKKNYE